MSLLKSIQNRFHTLVNRVQAAATGFFDALARSIEENGGQVLRNAALAAVRAAEATGGPGEKKFAAALNQVILTLQTEGVPVVINAVRGAIEAAVALENSGTKKGA